MNQKIYKIQIQMTCQADCDRMKQICIDYKLPHEKRKEEFEFEEGCAFRYSSGYRTFAIWWANHSFTTITIEQFLELLNEK